MGTGCRSAGSGHPQGLREAGSREGNAAPAAAAGGPEAVPGRAPWQDRVPRPSSEFPRLYLKTHADLSDWATLEPYLQELKDRPLPDRSALEKWIADLNELMNALNEEGSRLYIEMTCFTQDPQKEKAYLHFVEEVDPKLAPYSDALNRKAVAHPDIDSLPAGTFGKWRESLKVSIELFREENIPLQTEIAKLSQSYQKICSEMTAEWNGEKKTLSQLSPFLQDPDRRVREKAWRLIAESRYADHERLDSLFEELLALRVKMARNLGLPDYVEYAFKANQRTDYTREDCFRFHAAVEKTVVPRYRQMLEHRRARMGLDRLRPWDLSCDPLGRPPLRPFAKTEDLIQGVGRIFSRLDPELARHYERMAGLGLLDLENRIGKAPGGYQSSLEEVRLPFIFMNAVGLNDDVFTLLHESGHAFHSFYARHHDLGFNRHAPMEFSEVASMSMERLGAPFLTEFYDEASKARALLAQDEDVFRLLPWVATVDAFQHWIYTHPAHSREERRSFWLSLDDRFGSRVDWSGLEEFRGYGWHRQLHIFELPFYYIEYGIAQLGALQIWARSLRDPGEALSAYKRALALGGTRGLRGLFESAGLRLDLGEGVMAPLMDQVFADWDAYRVKDEGAKNG